jgi:hypothetical protein
MSVQTFYFQEKQATDVDEWKKNDSLPRKTLAVKIDRKLGRVKLPNLRALAE